MGTDSRRRPGCPATRFSSLVPCRGSSSDEPGTAQDKRKDGRYAGRVRLSRSTRSEPPTRFVTHHPYPRSSQQESAVAPRTLTVTDDWSGYASLGKRGYEHFAVAECGDPEVAEDYLPIIHLVFANLKTWLIGIHHGVSHQHLQAYLNEFTFRFLPIQRLPLPPRHRLTGASTHSRLPLPPRHRWPHRAVRRTDLR